MCAAQAEQHAAQASQTSQGGETPYPKGSKKQRMIARRAGVPPTHKEWLLHFRNFRKRKSHSVNHAGRC